MSAPVLVTHNSTILMVDANDLVVGAVLVQKDHCGVEHPIVYFHRHSTRTNKITAQVRRRG